MKNPLKNPHSPMAYLHAKYVLKIKEFQNQDFVSFKGTSQISDLDAKTAQIIDDFFVQNGPERLTSWIEQNQIKLLPWWDYHETKAKSNSILAPFCHFEDLDIDLPVSVQQSVSYEYRLISLRYLEIPYEMAMLILTLGGLPN